MPTGRGRAAGIAAHDGAGARDPPRRRAASARRRRRSPHPRAAVAFPGRRRLPRLHRRDRAGGARQAFGPEIRPSRPRRYDAGREWIRPRQSHPYLVRGADPDAHRARREGKPDHGARNRRRRLSGKTVRAARALAAHRQYLETRTAAGGGAGGIGALRPIRVPPRERRVAPRRGGDPADRPRARHAARAHVERRRDRAAPGARRQRRQCQRAHRRRAGQPAAPQDRTRPGQSADRADRARRGLPVGRGSLESKMTTFDDGIGRLRVAAGHVVTAANAVAGAAGYITGPWDRFTRWLRSVMPHGLYARALLIVIMPLVVLQSIVAFMFVERQSSVVNYYLSSAVTQEIATLIDVYKAFPPGTNRAQLRRIAQDRLGLVVDFLPGTDLPPPGPKPFFSSLDQELSNEIRKQIGLPFWIDTVGRSSIVEIRIKLDDAIMRVFAPRAEAYNSNSLIFLMWMVLTSVVVLTIAILFLRNQIKPIVRLADAAEAFGKGREAPNFRPRGAREVRRAAAAFLEMKIRIERAIEQRTTMLAGVSHDLRTVL